MLSKFEVAAKAKGAVAAQPIALKSVSADFSQEGFNITNVLAGTGEGWAIATFEKKNKVRRSASFSTAQPFEFAKDGTLTFTLRHTDKHVGANIQRFRLSSTDAEQVGMPFTLPEAVRAVFLVAAEKRDDKQRTRLREYFQSIAPELKSDWEGLTAKRKAEKDLDNSIPITSVMVELEKPRETHRHIRGAYLSQGEVVTPRTPAAFQPLPADQPTNRLGLAHWLVDPNNPLTARVIINRFWEQYFGKGIVETVEDFGMQSEPPSHPELLDWLASEFMRVGWDMKAVHKTIVLSATYRQSSRAAAESYQRDPDNRLFARGPRVRLEAEMIRDQALAVSGLLSHKLGGPSVMPPQPEGLWQVVYSGDKWETSKGEDKYRRGLYTFWRRSSPHPTMTTFDAPSREFCVLKRSRSNTPLQALNTLNDPAFVEAAQALARRVAAAPETEVKKRVTFAFRICLARAPTVAESDRLASLYEKELAFYKTDEKAAEKMAASELGKPKDGGNLAELAAWTVVANVLLNLDEMITKG